MRLGIDVGGTFTDFALYREGRFLVHKHPTTPLDPVQGVMAGLGSLAADLELSAHELLGALERIVHGTTIATNALLTGSSARTAFLTTRGHPDVLMLREAGRMGLPTFDFRIRNPRPFVPRALTYEIPERIDAQGRVVEPLDESVVADIVAALSHENVEAVAVCLLWSVLNPRHEQRLGEILRQRLPDVPVSLSHEVNPCLREYRRASSTCMDASLTPLTGVYCERLQHRLSECGFRGSLWMSTSDGTVAPVDRTRAIHLVRSGPALGPAAAARCLTPGEDCAVLIDVGGTTLDVTLLRGGVAATTQETWIGTPYIGHMTGFPSVDVRSLGAGGGSIAGVTANQLITVGPQSAGAEPGPACFGLGGSAATVTDAAVVLGYVDVESFAGRSAALNAEAARQALRTTVAEPLGLSVEEAAAAVMTIWTEDAAAGVEEMMVTEGMNPRASTLLATGGAAGLLAGTLARRLGCSRVVFPVSAAVNCAAGAVLADVRARLSTVRTTTSRQFDTVEIGALLDELIQACGQLVLDVDCGERTPTIELSVDARYRGQSWEIPVRFGRHSIADTGEIVALFHDEHERRHHYRDPSSVVEFLCWHAMVVVDNGITVAPCESVNDERKTPRPTSRTVLMPGSPARSVDILVLDDLRSVESRTGPAIIQSRSTTIVVESGMRVSSGTDGSVVVDVRAGL